MPKGYAEGPAAEEAERRLEELERGVSEVNCEPVSCMPSPESPAKRTITWESCSTGLVTSRASPQV